MPSGIVINFDYENNDHGLVHELFEAVRDGLIASGFRQHERLFTIDRPVDEACQLARLVMEFIESGQDAYKQHIFSYIKEFYGFEMENIANLMVPGVRGIEVDESVDAEDIEALVIEGYDLAV